MQKHSCCRQRRLARRLAAVSMAFTAAMQPDLARAQRANENVVTNADDAYGAQLGSETIGLYSAESVRGFSALDAGNVRVEGLYVDRQANFTSHLTSSTSIRVGASAQGYRLPAPTGIVDVALRKAGDETVISPSVGYGPYGGWYAEFDSQLRLTPQLGIAAGAGLYNDAFVSGADRASWSVAVIPRIDIGAAEVMPFWGHIGIYDFEPNPIVSLARGAAVPKPPTARRFRGPAWAQAKGRFSNAGVVSRIALGDGWSARSIVLRSVQPMDRRFVDLYAEARADGTAQRRIIADVGQLSASNSGELVVQKRFEDAERSHTFAGSLRGRDQRRRYGGSAVIALGAAPIGTPPRVAEPDLAFGPQTRDRVRQTTFGFTYQGLWVGRGSLDLGLQRADYQKTVRQPANVATTGSDKLWLPNAGLTLFATPRLALFGSYARGLEEGDIAPANATNKDAAPPAVRTSQIDAGVSYALTPKLRLIGSGFEVKKPYFGLAADGSYGRRGSVRHRGLELSIAGPVADGLTLIAGGVLLQARVEGDEVARGLIGRRPAGRAAATGILNLDYRPPANPALSFDVGVTGIGNRTAGADNRSVVPGRATLDVGARYRLDIGGAPAVLRLVVGNVFDSVRWDVDRSGILRAADRRRATVNLTADF